MKTNRTAGWTTNLEDSQSKALTLLMKGKQNMDTNRCVTVLVIYVLTFSGPPESGLEEGFVPSFRA